MNSFEEIKRKFEDFNTYLKSIDLDELKGKHSRAELKQLSSDLYDIKIRSLAYDISKMVDEMKKEEFPELLGVHRFPILKEIDFLTEQEKIALDKHLMMVRKGNYLYGLRNVTRNSEKEKKIKEFLLEKEMVKESHFALCPSCGTGHISRELNTDEKNDLNSIFEEKIHEEREGDLNSYLEYICMDCEGEPEIMSLTKLYFKTVQSLTVERDASLDNV